MNGAIARTVVGLVLISALALAAVGCDLLGVTKQARIEQFLADLNEADRTDAYLNFSPDCLNYAGLTHTYFGIKFPVDDRNYYFSGLNYDASPVTGKIISDGVSFPAPGNDIEFTLVKDGSDWLISVLWIDGPGYVVQ